MDRFLREFAARLSGEAVFLYFFLAAVSDKQGLSFYADSTIADRLRMSEGIMVRAREELIDFDLIAYQPPLTQVLSLPVSRVQRRQAPGSVLAIQLGHSAPAIQLRRCLLLIR